MKGEKVKMKYFLIGASLCVLIGAITLASTIKRKAEFTYDDFFNELEKKNR